MSKRESFILLNRELRVTTDSSGNRTIQGQLPYLSPSSGLPWTETITPGAFSDALKPDAGEILLLRNHDVSQLFANSQAKTLVLSDSPDGLNFSAVLPKTNEAASLIESITRKDLSGVSFGFVCQKDTWQDDGKGNLLRSLDAVTLFEISLVNWAAFPKAGFSLRSVPKVLRSLVKRSDSEDDDEDENDDCQCEKNPDGTHVDPDCHCDDEDGEHDEDENRSTKLTFAERTLLQIQVLRLQ